MNDHNVFKAYIDSLVVAVSQLEGGEPNSRLGDISLEYFWNSVDVSVTALSHEITQLCVMFSKQPIPNDQQTDGILKKIETTYASMLTQFYHLPKSKGTSMRKKIQQSLLKLLDAVRAVLQSLKETGVKGQKDRLKLAGCVWESCEAFEHIPHDNLEATFEELEKEQMLVADALQEIEHEVKAHELGTEGVQEEIDNTERWNNQDHELLLPCIALVRTARSCLGRIIRAVKQKGACNTEHEVAQLDDLVAAVLCLSPIVDEFVLSVYPPMNRDVVKRTAMDVVKELQAILSVAKQSHYVQEEDQSWVTFLLNAVDHNNNKLQPLLS